MTANGSETESVVAVVVGGDDAVVDALAGDGGIDVQGVDGVGEALQAVGTCDGGAVVVVDDAAAYKAVRAERPDVPVALVADAGPDLVERVVSDPAADHVAPAAPLETVLPARVGALAERSSAENVWQLAGVADEAVVAFDLDTGDVWDANDTFFDQWGWDRSDLPDATLADLRETDITHELRGQRREEGEADRAWVHDDDPVESLVENARGGRYDSREWHCLDDEGRGFKTTVRVLADEGNGRGYLVATVPSGSADADPGEGSMLRSLMEHVPMSVYFKDTEARHVLVSEDVVEPFIESPEGKILHTPPDVHGKTDFDLYPADLASESVAEDREVMETGHPIVDRIEEVQPPHGRPLFFTTTKAPWYDSEGRVRGIIGITVDITDQKRRERELDRQNERLSEFASIVSHDLRNPLNVAKGRLQLYRERGDEESLEGVAEMHDRMEALIEDVLTFAREGSRVEDTEWLDPAEAASDAWGAVDTDGAALEQAWRYRLSADPGRLVRLLENLFRNAVEHGPTSPDSGAREDATEQGRPDDEALTVRVGTLDDESGFFVADDGRGIPEDKREEVFDRGVTTSSDGTGFGLPIVREIATAHGWNVTLTESDDGGARFEFSGVPRGSERESEE